MSARRTLEAAGSRYEIACLHTALEACGGPQRFPASILVLLENLLRSGGCVFDPAVTAALQDWPRGSAITVPFRPSRVLLQDYTGIPVLVDLAALQEAADARGLPPGTFGCAVPTHLVIDHSLSVDLSGAAGAAGGAIVDGNAAIEMDRNRERFTFLKWAEAAFPGLRLFPPGAGICHQINMEQLAQVVCALPPEPDGLAWATPDTVLGADSHTTTINGLGVLGWGVGGIEALTALLGNPVSMLLPEIVGVRLTGRLSDVATATDLVLSMTERLRQVDVVGRFVEFFGPGLAALPAAHRATVANMTPEAGATCLFFPVDDETLRYLRLTGRDTAHVELVEAYARVQGLWRDADTPEADFTRTIEFDLGAVEPCLAGPNRPEQRIPLSGVAAVSRALGVATGTGLQPGDVVLAAITSCTNTANPHSVFAAGLLARNAVAAGLVPKPWVKTSFAPGSRAVQEYLGRSGLQDSLDALGFGIVGFGCTTCIGNAGPLRPEVAAALAQAPVAVSAVLSGNRNFANRVHPQVPANFLASPALVVAYALAGTTHLDLTNQPLGNDPSGRPVHLADLWPSRAEIEAEVAAWVGPGQFRTRPGEREGWGGIDAPSDRFPWSVAPTYIARPPFTGTAPGVPLRGARILGLFGDGVTTDHISPASPIRPGTLAGAFLAEHGVAQDRLHTFGARRGHWEVLLLGAFTNPALRNEMAPGAASGMTRHWPDGGTMPIQHAAARYGVEGVPLVLVAGRNYGTGSSRDDAAKSTRYLGIRAVIAESFERIHRSNLLALGVLPLTFPPGVTRRTLGLTGAEVIDIDVAPLTGPGAVLPCRISGHAEPLGLNARIETADELAYWQAGGLVPHLLDAASYQPPFGATGITLKRLSFRCGPRSVPRPMPGPAAGRSRRGSS